MPHRSPRRRAVLLAGSAVVAALALSGLSTTGALYTDSKSVGSNTFTTRAACAAGTGYPTAVKALGPTFYYRFGEAAGATTVADSSGNGNTGTVRTSSPNTGVAPALTFGAAGSGLIWCDTTGLTSPKIVGTLNSGSFVVWPSARANLNTFSIMAWVRTSTTTGGRILGQSSSTWAKDVHYDRQLIFTDTGHVAFDVYPGFNYAMTSTAALNDGLPHFLVATLGPAGATLYVDGVLDQSDPTRTTAETYTTNENVNPPPAGAPRTPDGQGYWRVGWDNLASWGATDFGLNGVIDEAALFENQQLGAGQVAGLWAKNHW